MRGKEEMDDVREKLLRIGFPFRLIDIDFDVTKIPEIKSYISKFPHFKESEGLYLFGESDAGKTTIAICIIKTLARARKVQSVFYANVPDLISEIYSSYKSGGYCEKAEKSKEAKILVFDDFGVERYTENMGVEIYRIINYRYERALPMIITSNCSQSEIAGKFEDSSTAKRIYSRILKMTDEVKIDVEF